MKRRLKENVLLATGIFVLSGCAGYDRILFVTKTNIGLDVDNKPPTAEITIARRELAITPTFQDAEKDEKTLPLLASFGLSGGFLDPEITSRFAGGRAALVLAQGPNRLPGLPRTPGLPQTEEDPFLCLSDKPDMRPLWKQLWHFITLRAKEDVKDDTRAFYFATDTSFGLKAGWDGTTGPYPDTLKLGYNRKELAFPPIFSTKHCTGTDGKWKVTVPSFIASLDNSSSIKEWSEVESHTFNSSPLVRLRVLL